MRMRSALLFSLCCLWLAPVHAADFEPDPCSVQRHGQGYRYPQAGWIVLHIEGEPYDRGVQHGRLLATEIAGNLQCCAASQCSKAPTEGWKQTRTLVNALFLRRFDREYLEEMKGIADGARAAGAQFDGRAIDLIDIAALNASEEVDTLDSALEALPTGLEGVRFGKAVANETPRPKPARCSAFAAVGPATRDGKILIGHITMSDLYSANYTNVWLDIKPAKGRRVLMQTFAGGIQSGMDYYLNDAGLVVCETTIDQTRFDVKGMTLASRVRKAVQYAENIDRAVEILREDNNGLYTNEWLLADIKTNEIAMFELGTRQSRLWRSGKHEWFGGTEGFYWGCNNTKDLAVRLETVASLKGRPAQMVFRPSDRDKMWLKLYDQHKGKFDADFAKLAFATPPLVAYHAVDAKFTTTELARQLKSWALYGPPLGRTWAPTKAESDKYPEIKPLVANPWTVLNGKAPAPAVPDAKTAVDLGGLGDHSSLPETGGDDDDETTPAKNHAWHGTILPKTDADLWLAIAFAKYERVATRENALRKKGSNGKLSATEREKLALALFAFRADYELGARAAGDVALTKLRSDLRSDNWYRIASGKGALLLHALREKIEPEKFDEMMDRFGKEHAGMPVSTATFCEFVEKAAGQPLTDFFHAWLDQIGLPPIALPPAVRGKNQLQEMNSGPFGITTFYAELDQTLIVYGAGEESPANREAADALQQAIRARHANVTVPIKSDGEVTAADLKKNHLLLIGRPDSNRLVERFRAALPISFGSRSFVVRGDTYAHAGSAVIAAAANPENPRYSMVAIAGLEANSTWTAAPKLPRLPIAEVVVLPNGGSAKPLVVKSGATKVENK
jgi:hypothetical protein